MTNDLIIRSELLKKSIRVTETDEGGWGRELRAVPVEEIEKAQAVDAKPVKHGRWIEVPTYDEDGYYDIEYRCSECGRVEYWNNEPYCHCGARMDKEADHAQI